jgi:excinuclease ABC subunit A
LIESLELAFKKSEGLVIIGEEEKENFIQKIYVVLNVAHFEELEPRIFSFNSPFGACEDCHGLGVKIEFD